MLTTLLAVVLAATQLTLPQPTGPLRVGTATAHLVDTSRPDPWVAAERHRELMVQVWYPARSVRGHQRADWVSPGVAAIVNPPDSGFTLPVTHGYVGAPPAPGRHPVLLYSPGFGVERTASTALVEDLAGHGYVVVTIDHPHDAGFVEFPDGRIALRDIPTPTSPEQEEQLLDKVLDVRVTDTRFVLSRLRELPAATAMDLSRIGMFGHSMGGATAAATMLVDRRIRAGLNLDGSFTGPVIEAGLNRPFLMLGSDTHGDEQDETWTRTWAKLRGPRYWLELTGSAHLSFSDYQVLFHQIGLPADQIEQTVGSIDGDRSVAIQRAYVRAFFDRHLRGRPGTLLNGPSPRYPEISFPAAAG
ncbi:Alpha/beta hydrolase family protein [Actinoplanes derwentensis]|uniref:Alpha/beta hydrolase family protein n=2 Tax=Actinoplanes derwentensis TaxID=113562 RepID=A0A1H1YLK3_9ACTN|nr:Alpha/beta hydrolase family protein [Actinoplanes derwentensis]